MLIDSIVGLLLGFLGLLFFLRILFRCQQKSIMATKMGMAAQVFGTVVATALVIRIIKRRFFSSDAITSALQCECGKIKGEICAKVEDIICYCEDCRHYAEFVAREGGKKAKFVQGGGTQLVQVCKQAIKIHEGKELMQLARKDKKGEKEEGMHRYYATCCHVPIMNTVSFLGFVGVIVDRLDGNAQRYDKPCRYCPGEAVGGEAAVDVPDMNPWRFVWNLIRYAPWASSGPFDYDQESKLWGSKAE